MSAPNLDSTNLLQSLQDSMYADFQLLTKDEQIRRILLAGNAEFVLRMTEGTQPDTEVGRSVIAMREALTRYL